MICIKTLTAVALTIPLVAGAATWTVSGALGSASSDFVLGGDSATKLAGGAANYTLSADTFWNDTFVGNSNDGSSTTFPPDSFLWTLLRQDAGVYSTYRTGSIADTSGLGGTKSLSFQHVDNGSYRLSVSLSWSPHTVDDHTWDEGWQGGAVALENLKAAAAPVPEPESYALLLAGLGLLGTMTLRRKGL